jgi:hypothetical protein
MPDEYEKLLRVLYGEPIQPPPIGKKPDFTKKPATGIKGTSSQPATAVSGVSTGSVSLLGPPEKRPNAVAHARYDRPGVAGPWESAHVRILDIDGEKKYSFETSRGGELWITDAKDRSFPVTFSFGLVSVVSRSKVLIQCLPKASSIDATAQALLTQKKSWLQGKGGWYLSSPTPRSRMT